ncbi:plasmid mobilization protein [Pedobacter jamesrossensis]|uniref:Plasmid mobilization relaxosome protein MobC n=1 Tax=Pedobacter jamesrossensis TaxID=1908238 RepID=A0ABV8NM45_9SPHI
MEKETNINFRISPDDKLKVEKKAEEAGLALSQFARKVLLDGNVIKVELEDRKIISGIANNLNQLTRKFNRTNILPIETVDTLNDIIKALRHAYRKL